MKIKGEEVKTMEEVKTEEEGKTLEAVKMLVEVKTKEEVKMLEEVKTKEEVKMLEVVKTKEEVKLLEVVKMLEEVETEEEVKTKEEVKDQEVPRFGADCGPPGPGLPTADTSAWRSPAVGGCRAAGGRGRRRRTSWFGSAGFLRFHSESVAGSGCSERDASFSRSSAEVGPGPDSSHRSRSALSWMEMLGV